MFPTGRFLMKESKLCRWTLPKALSLFLALPYLGGHYLPKHWKFKI
jgi:hypothetical protein